MGDSSLLDGRRNYFGREDYWYSNSVRDGRNVHDNYLEHNVDFEEIQEGNLNILCTNSHSLQMHACEDAQGDRRKLVFDTGIHKESLMHMFRKSIADFSE